MGSNWNVAREAQSVAELEQLVAEAKAEATMTLNEVGEYGRPYREAMENVRLAERRLERAQYKEKRHKELAERTPAEIVDSIMRP